MLTGCTETLLADSPNSVVRRLWVTVVKELLTETDSSGLLAAGAGSSSFAACGSDGFLGCGGLN